LCITACDCDNQATAPDEEYFIYVLYDGLELEDIAEISEELETKRDGIIDALKVDNIPKTTVKIWADYGNFLDDMEADIGTRYTGATGYVYDENEIRFYFNNYAPLTAIHEFAHIVSMHVNITIPNNPRWLWEAVALYLTDDFIHPKTLPYMVSGDYPTLSELNIDYNNSNHSIYSVGYVLLEYVVETWNMDTVIQLIETNGNLNQVLDLTTEQFELGWYSYIESDYL
jgi:hypothetical protein